jgi:hypothetical protein
MRSTHGGSNESPLRRLIQERVMDRHGAAYCATRWTIATRRAPRRGFLFSTSPLRYLASRRKDTQPYRRQAARTQAS